jgi:hypothetical protein
MKEMFGYTVQVDFFVVESLPGVKPSICARDPEINVVVVATTPQLVAPHAFLASPDNLILAVKLMPALGFLHFRQTTS